MGWTATNKPQGMSLKEFFASEFDCNNVEAGSSGKVLDCAAHLNAAYIAYEIKKDGARKVIAIVCLTKYYKDSYYNFGYKDMDETMGPYYYDCPQRILSLLTPTDNQSAMEWRVKCHANNNKPKPQKLNVGAIIEFEKPIYFQSSQLSKFKVASIKPLRFTSIDGFSYYRIRRSTLREIPYKLIT